MGMAWGAVERMMKLQEVICRALAGSLTWLQAADILELDPRTVRRWRARYQAGGRLALYDRRHGPSPRKAPAPEVARVLRLYREQSACSGARIISCCSTADRVVSTGSSSQIRMLRS